MTGRTTALSPRHERFVLEFLKDGNATRAYIRAGYSPHSAQPCASRLLRRPHVETAIAAGRQRIAAALGLSVERIGREYARIAFANIDDYIQVEEDGRPRIDLEKASRAQRAGIVEMKFSNHSKPQHQVTLKLNKLQALAALTDRMGLFAEQPGPAPPSADRARYERAIAKLAEDRREATMRLIEVEEERDAARAMLADAQARLAAVVPTPSPRACGEKENHSNPCATAAREAPPAPDTGRSSPTPRASRHRTRLVWRPATRWPVPRTIANHSNRDPPVERRGPTTTNTPCAIALPAIGRWEEAALNPAPRSL